MTNRYKNRKNAVVNPPFDGKHCKTFDQRVRRHNLNVVRRGGLKQVFLSGYTHANVKGGVINAN